MIRRVQDLWDEKEELTDDRERSAWFIRCFGEVVGLLHRGESIPRRRMPRMEYWKYLQTYHPSWRQVPLPKPAYDRIVRKFKNGIGLYYDIKANGMRDPLLIVVDGDRQRLVKGWRRLVILKTLGTEEAEVAYEIVDSSRGAE